MHRIFGYMLYIVVSFTASYLMHIKVFVDTEYGVFKFLFLIWGIICSIMLTLELYTKENNNE